MKKQKKDLRKLAIKYRTNCISEYFDGKLRAWIILVTLKDIDNDLNFMNFIDWVYTVQDIEIFDCRKNTIRCRLYIQPQKDDIDIIVDAVKKAQLYDYTVQLLCRHGIKKETGQDYCLDEGVSVKISDMQESYPILHLGSHGLKW